MNPAQKFYLTTPIYYVNARPHIGHAYTTIVADVVARRHRLLGDPTWFLTGTDEHGQKIERSASAAGIPPQQFADEVSASFENLWQRMGITNDDFIRTTDARHKQGAQKLFAELYARGQIYLSAYTGQYCVSEEIFVEGPPGAIGPDGRPTETVTEENFFFRLSDFQRPLLDLIESNTFAITPEARKNEILSFLRGNLPAIKPGAPDLASETWEGTPGAPLTSQPHRDVGGNENPHIAFSNAGHPYLPGALRDLSVSRSSFTWGIPVPEPAASATTKKHVMYVWLDALANYITAIGYGSDDPAEQARFETLWPADLHLVGKEITRQHCIYWPAFLLAAGLPLPKAVVAHGWLLFEESKMSKSRGNIVRTETILDAFGPLCSPQPSSNSPGRKNSSPHELSSFAEGGGPALSDAPPSPTKHDQDLFAADVLRYFLLREIPFGQDGSFSFDAMISRYNADLANGYGNLVSRTLSMIANYKEGILPETQDRFEPAYIDIVELFGFAGFANETLALAFDRNDFGQVLFAVNSFIARADAFLTARAPWKIAKDDGLILELDSVLYTAAEAIRILTALLYPILPYATAKVWAQLGLGDIEAAATRGDLRDLQWGGLQPGTKLGPLAPIFPRADKGLAQIMTDIEAANAPARPDASLKAASTPTPAAPVSSDPTHPAAPPRTSGMAEADPIAQVGGAATPHPELHRPPSHTQAQASGVFAGSTAASPVTASPATASSQITIDDFAKVELRVARILVAERIPKADKLLRLEVDLGYEQRQILSGIAEWYAPEDLVGRKIVVITNLAPRTMRGLESHGMLLAASHADNGKPVLATFAEEIEVGARLK